MLGGRRDGETERRRDGETERPRDGEEEKERKREREKERNREREKASECVECPSLENTSQACSGLRTARLRKAQYQNYWS